MTQATLLFTSMSSIIVPNINSIEDGVRFLMVSQIRFLIVTPFKNNYLLYCLHFNSVLTLSSLMLLLPSFRSVLLQKIFLLSSRSFTRTLLLLTQDFFRIEKIVYCVNGDCKTECMESSLASESICRHLTACSLSSVTSSHNFQQHEFDSG